MRIAFITALLLSVFVWTGPAAGADPAINGTWWNGLYRSEKTVYVIGFFDGQTYTEMVYDLGLLLAQSDPKTGQFNIEEARAIIRAE